ncbi:hypothetical protein EVAR_27282_1 [Eumeta japonica]|uniref:Uncharacterized protein n=1 Tax=Eumeta variegata TaxID=151549 RepID=A0A4C1W194_EUMVA|nr:hypothetical protein EVAR_27282_1 [Eumeta japonica]
MEFLPPDKTNNSDLYCQQSMRLKQEVPMKLINKRSVVLHHNNNSSDIFLTIQPSQAFDPKVFSAFINNEQPPKCIGAEDLVLNETTSRNVSNSSPTRQTDVYKRTDGPWPFIVCEPSLTCAADAAWFIHEHKSKSQHAQAAGSHWAAADDTLASGS